MKKFPEVIPVFPLSGVIYFPKTNLPLNIFEQRYLDLVNDAYNKALKSEESEIHAEELKFQEVNKKRYLRFNKLIKNLKPNIYCKGADYLKSSIKNDKNLNLEIKA